MRIAFFEDRHAVDLHPVSLMRPAFELLCGQFPLRERVLRTLHITEWGAFVRPYLAETYAKQHPEASVNDFHWLGRAETTLINGRWIPDEPGLRQLADSTLDDVGMVDGQVAFLRLDPAETALLDEAGWSDAVDRIAHSRTKIAAAGAIAGRPWDLVNHNASQLTIDFKLRLDGLHHRWAKAVDPGEQLAEVDSHVSILGDRSRVWIDSTAEIEPFVVLDARHGPISIEAGARIQSFTRLEGPCHVGRESQLFRANIREGTTIGPACRVGGEVEESILHGFANKYHDGFLGHAYVCPWVNLGALTTNSDLKNDYSPVKVPINGELVNSGSTKVGCFIGDHTKTALVSPFNTGSNIGCFCMVLPGGELLPKHIPSFARIWHGQLDDDVQLEQCFATARTAMNRRNCEFTRADERLVRHLHSMTESERAGALERMQQKQVNNRLEPGAISPQ